MKRSNLNKLASTLDSQCHFAGVESTLNDLLSELGLTQGDFIHDASWSVNYNDTALSVSLSETRGRHDEDLYERVMSSKNTMVLDTEHIYWSSSRLVKHLPQGTETRVSVSLFIPLPAEDLEQLRMLGKVHTQLRESRIEESVSCLI